MSKYQVGDELRIREFDDMAAEYPHTNFGRVEGDYYAFVRSMNYLCGKDFTVSDVIIDRYGHITYKSYEGIEHKNDYEDWFIQEFMLEPRTSEDLYIATDLEINELLFTR